MKKTFVERFPKKDVTEDQIKALCKETKDKVIGCESCTYKSDDTAGQWVVTSVINMLS
jgi:hypothetical protein